MITNSKELYIFLDSLVCPEGYVRKKDTYYRDHAEFIVCYAVGKSQWGGQYGSTMGCFYKAILKKKKEFPEFYQAHVRFSLQNFVDEGLVKRVFDLENNEFKDEEREVLMKEFVELYVIPFLNEISTVEGLRMAMDKYKDLRYSTRTSIREALGLPEID